MGYNCPSGCPRVQRFSNRIITYNGQPIGSASADNARSIRSYAGTAAGYRASSASACDVANEGWVGDGWCDQSGGYNTAACGWDGGDCCAETCQPGEYDCTEPMQCFDPSV